MSAHVSKIGLDRWCQRDVSLLIGSFLHWALLYHEDACIVGANLWVRRNSLFPWSSKVISLWGHRRLLVYTLLRHSWRVFIVLINAYYYFQCALVSTYQSTAIDLIQWEITSIHDIHSWYMPFYWKSLESEDISWYNIDQAWLGPTMPSAEWMCGVHSCLPQSTVYAMFDISTFQDFMCWFCMTFISGVIHTC